MDCLFCRIAKKEVPSKIVFENEQIFAFWDIDPKAPVHILIVPKKHISGLNDITCADNELLGKLANAAKDIAKKENIDKSGFRLVVNCGKDAGQAVDHIHFHLLGGRKLSWPPG
ncbi:MAG: histidine triad nucleotide-binding protein [Elusimicrobia bacterium]|nr:histidine triad nucleotide-binding protein [Candidatus Liberimonas magnetica]